MITRKTSLAAAVLTAAALTLTACGGGGTPAAADLTKVSIMAPYLEAQPPASDGAVHQKLEELTGKDIEISWVPNASYGDKQNITMASDDIPQLMVFTTKSSAFIKNAEAGAFWDLTDKLEKYPNLKTNTPEVQANSSINGKVYGVFRARSAMRSAVMFRQDWLDKLGLEAPKTTEDLYKVAKAFTEQDPDGNGQNDTYGITIPKWGGLGTNSPYDLIEEWYGAGNRWTEKDGKLVPSFETDEFLEANAFVKKMISEGLVNPDFATFDPTKWNEPFLNGKGGIIIDVDSRVSQIINLFKQTNPADFENKVGFVGNLEGPDGELHAHPTDGYAGFIAASKSQVRTEAELDKVLEFLNEMNSEEVAVLLNNGIEGVNFQVVDGAAAPITPETPEGKAVNTDVKSYAQLGINVRGNNFYLPKQASEYEQQVYDKRLEVTANDLKSAVYNPAAPYVSETYVSKGAQLDNIVSDARIQYLAGQIDEQGLKDAIKLWNTSGGDKVKEEINKLWQENK
ncbi:extracellular solute-binding protein [Pseudarthrobacter sp. J75]|uniref:extracellular solute-binding protein n=1 Tax=unclassified Pseudarthrobacter TaxID=2647000 RepID=UPI002E81BD8E|nr:MULTISPECIES: extracellular solute-binding protein [unclassified Pseudarthrobacter]MEE2522220.1 extracellular solute-binding protein [Pseudarthrobacter sp. J47]MEE2528134.1 extracellular solute-binding protein [Pseudarthrobacter sp. J75]MEE2567836.1 extracellular solute-binding protein [Pseudarthrobacter sp. J64]